MINISAYLLYGLKWMEGWTDASFLTNLIKWYDCWVRTNALLYFSKCNYSWYYFLGKMAIFSFYVMLFHFFLFEEKLDETSFFITHSKFQILTYVMISQWLKTKKVNATVYPSTLKLSTLPTLIIFPYRKFKCLDPLFCQIWEKVTSYRYGGTN